MIVENFKRWVVNAITLTQISQYATPTVLDVEGNEIAGYIEYGVQSVPISLSTSSYIALGTDSRTTDKDDYSLYSDITNSGDFSSTSIVITPINTLDTKRIVTQTYTYSGSEEVTISEIGLYCRCSSRDGAKFVMIARVSTEDRDELGNPILNPIVVRNPGDMFTVSMTIQ